MSSDNYSYRDDKETLSRKRTYEEDSADSERQSKRMHPDAVPLLKILIPNFAAGAIIGKGGQNIAELQKQYGAKIRLSPSGEFYPDTDERIVILTGEVNQIIDLHNYIIDKVHADSIEGPNRFKDEERGQKIKIICPNITAGLIIGKKGSTIKSLQEETKAKIVITGREESKVLNERIITISGNTEQRIEAARQVVTKIAADSENMNNKNLTYPSGGGRGGRGGRDSGRGRDDFPQGGNDFLGNMLNQQNALSGVLGQNTLSNIIQQSGLANQFGLGSGATNGLGGLSGFGGSALPQQLQSLANNFSGATSGGGVASQIKTSVVISMEIPDILVGAILGRQGRTIHEFIQFSGAKIQLSSKNEFAPGTTDRILTIEGDLNQTQIAYFLINQKINQAESELASIQPRR